MLPLVLEATKSMNPAAKVFVGASAVVAYLAKSSADKEHEFRLKEIDYKSDIRSKEFEIQTRDATIASLKKELSKKWF